MISVQQLTDVCECSIYYRPKTGLITVGRPHGTRFDFTPENFVKCFRIVKHETDTHNIERGMRND